MKALNRMIVTIAGLFLIVAGLLKVHQLLTTPVVSDGFWESWLFFVIQVPLEIGLGVWLVSGLFRKAAWIIGTIAYLGFIFVAAHKLIIGAESCGCFGNIHVDPRITLFAIDIPLFLLMAIFRPKGEKLLPPPWPHAFHCLAIAIPACLFIGAVVPVLYFNKVEKKDIGKEWVHPKPVDIDNTVPNGTDPVDLTPIDPTDNGPDDSNTTEIEPNGADTTVVEPDDETPDVVKPDDPVKVPDPVEALPKWPWLESANIADQIDEGMVIVICYRSDCDDCHEAIPVYLEMAQEIGVGEEDAPKMAFLEIPPYGEPEDTPIPADTKCLSGKLAEGREDYKDFATPVVVALMDGVVKGAWEAETPDFETIFTAFAQ